MLNNKGCQIPMLVVGGLLMVGFVAMGFAPGLFQNNGSAKPGEKPVATVGKVPVSSEFLDRIMTRATRNYPAEFIGQPEVSAMVYQGALSQATMLAAVEDVATERGIKLDDKTVESEYRKNIEDEIGQMVTGLKGQGQLKPDAKDADIDALFTKQYGADRKSLVEREMDDVKANLGTPGLRLLAVAPVLQKRLLDDEKKKASYSEEELKKSFDSYTFDVVKFNKPGLKPEEVRLNADKALADLKAGKLVEDVRKEYGKPLAKDEKSIQILSRGALEADPQSKDLLALKAGEVSSVIEQFGETKIMKLVTVENKLPADFDKTKAQMIDQKKQSLAEKKLVEDLRKRAEGAKWNSPGLGAMAEWAATTTNEKIATDPAKRLDAVQKVYDKISVVKDENPLGRKALALATFAATSDLYQAAKNPTDKAKWGKARLAAYSACFAFTDSAESRLNAADLALEISDKDALAENLLEAVRVNIQYNAQGAQLQTRAAALLDKAKKASAIADADATKVQKELDGWTANKEAFEKDQAEVAREKATANAKANEEQAKMKAEEQKAIDEAKGKASAPSPVPTIPGVGGGK